MHCVSLWSFCYLSYFSRGFREMTSCLSPFSALSLVLQRQSTKLFEEAHIFYVMVDLGHRIHRHAWFNSGHMHCVSLQWLGFFTEFLSVKVDSDPEVASVSSSWTSLLTCASLCMSCSSCCMPVGVSGTLWFISSCSSSTRSWRRGLMSCGVDFLGPCTQVLSRESCPQGHGPHN